MARAAGAVVVVAVTLSGKELAYLPSALRVYLHVPFRSTVRAPPSADDVEALQRISSVLSLAVTRAYAEVGGAAGVSRPDLIARRKTASVTIDLARGDLMLLCRALREVVAEYASEPRGINPFCDGDEYGIAPGDLLATTERLSRILEPDPPSLL